MLPVANKQLAWWPRRCLHGGDDCVLGAGVVRERTGRSRRRVHSSRGNNDAQPADVRPGSTGGCGIATSPASPPMPTRLPSAIWSAVRQRSARRGAEPHGRREMPQLRGVSFPVGVRRARAEVLSCTRPVCAHMSTSVCALVGHGGRCSGLVIILQCFGVDR